MNLKLKALGKTAGMFVVCALVGIGVVEILHRLPQDWIPTIFITFLVGFLFWIAYSLNLAQLESKEKLKELTKGFDK